MTETQKHRDISLGGAILIFAVILSIIVVGRLIFGFDVALLLMFIGMFTTAVYVFHYKYTWQELFDNGVVPMIARASGAIMILLTVGPLIAAWMVSGTIPYLIYTGLQLLSPKSFQAGCLSRSWPSMSAPACPLPCRFRSPFLRIGKSCRSRWRWSLRRPCA